MDDRLMEVDVSFQGVVLGCVLVVLDCMEASNTPTLGTIVPMFGVLSTAIDDMTNATFVVGGKLHKISVRCIFCDNMIGDDLL